MDNCKDNSKCVNTPGSYTCKCVKGYKLDILSGKCIDIDECKENLHDCDDEDRAICENRLGGYYCACKLPRFTGDGKKCQEVPDEGCNKNCHSSAYCTLADGSPKCVCRSGYVTSKNSDGTLKCDGMILFWTLKTNF